MMWDGPRRGPQGGPPFRGDNRGEMFGGRDGPMSDFRGRDGMNMGPRGLQDRGPPMDMRRMDCPPDMRDRDMEPHDIRGRGEPPRDFLGRPGEEPDFSLRRQYETSIRDKLLNAAAGGGFMGPGPGMGGRGMVGRDVRGRGMGGRGMPPRDLREPNDRFIDMRDRDMFRKDMPGFNNPDMDGRRGGFPMEPMGRNEGFRDMCDRDRPPMGMDDIDGFNMDMPPRERDRDRGMMDFDRRGAPPLNPRKRFESDTDFRNRVGPPAEFRGRDRSPVRFADNDGALMDVRGRPGGPPDLGGPNRPKFVGTDPEGTLRDREFPEMEEVSLAEEWKNRKKEKDSHPSPMPRGLPPFSKEIQGERFPPVSREGSLLGEPANFKDRNMPSTEFPGKKDGPPFDFPRPNREAPCSQNWDKKPPTDIPGMDLPPFGRRSLQDPAFPPMGPGLLPNMPNRENDGKRWPEHGDPKQNQNAPNRVDRPPYLLEKDRPPYILEKTPPTPLGHGPNDKTRFKGPKDALLEQGPGSVKLVPGPDFQGKDQDYRDNDYRTGPGIVFDYKHEELPGPDKVLKESKAVPVPKFSDSGSQDQDYRSASVKDKVTHTICITGIPKTATMEQILGAFAVRDGVPMQGMKIKNVVPGYSYDTAYVEFLNLEDAVHFMESNQGSLKVGTKTALMRYVQPDRIGKEALEPGHKAGPPTQEPLLPCPGQLLVDKAKNEHHSQDVSQAKTPVDPLSQQGSWQRSSDLTPEAWQQQVDQQLRQQEAEQQAESWASRNPRRQGPGPHQMDPIFKESKTMIIKNVKPTTTVETILKSLDPFAYLDERNVRLVRGKPPGAKCFCFVDMDSHEQVTRLVELLTKPRPLSIDGVRVYAEIAKPLKNQKYRKEFDKSNTSLLGYPPEASMTEQQYYSSQPPNQPPGGPPPNMQGDHMGGPISSDPLSNSSVSHLNSSMTSGGGYAEPPPVDPYHQALDPQVSSAAAAGGLAATGDHGTDGYSYATETPDMTNYLYDATSGFYYDPQTTLYYDPASRYFYNAQTQEYLYWDSVSKTYIPVPGGHSTDTQLPIAQSGVALAPDVQAILANPAADAPLDMKRPEPTPHFDPPQLLNPTPAPNPNPNPSPERREEEDTAPRIDKKDNKDKPGEKEEKPRSLAAFKIMKDMERWAKIQNRQKDSVRVPSPVLKASGGGLDDRKSSKAADAAFTIFERKGGDDLFKKPMAPPKKEGKGSKQSIGSLGLLASDYAATGSDEEEEVVQHEDPQASRSQSQEKEDKLTDWKKMACLLCRRQFPNKDGLLRHQQLSDLHKQNMEIHMKIKRSKKELEALENQEKELSARESNGSPEQKRRKHQHQNSWVGGSRDMHKGSERPGLGSEPVERKKKESVVWNHATYKQAVRKAMFARFKELD
uniref:RNA-binding protein 6-like isoform X1 n=1 Tax=Oncorhynchus gorbuscha TaxID=8017 RepID=UPI001EAEA97B|nr:RNA-binding protein 6-like isoform X1 [Oncorhynchus gorbuscha]XP_046166268.1 RNA-binding protein 6-like isoform X1 [Oncorhynchus gorbuscha]